MIESVDGAASCHAILGDNGEASALRSIHKSCFVRRIIGTFSNRYPGEVS